MQKVFCPFSRPANPSFLARHQALTNTAHKPIRRRNRESHRKNFSALGGNLANAVISQCLTPARVFLTPSTVILVNKKARSDTGQPGDPDQSSRIRPSGGYRELRSFQVATLIYDGTVTFCERFIDARSRTVDQMVQAARSGRQNIAEGSRASATSSQTELRLVNVARASLDELLLDYEDFLRQRQLTLWGKDSP